MLGTVPPSLHALYLLNPLSEGETDLSPFYSGKRKCNLREVKEITKVTSARK